MKRPRTSHPGPLYRLSIALVGLLLLATIMITYGMYYYNSPGPLSEPTTIVFKKGMGFRDIVDSMSSQGIITNPIAFKAIAVTLGDARKFKAGEYRFSAAISPRLIMDMIAEGRVVVHKITVAEGLTVRDVMALLNNESALEGAVVGEIKEGSLLPNTYHFVYGDSKRDLIDRMQAGMKTTTDELWPKRKEGLPFTTLEEAVTLASIVEKETSLDSERGRVAAVYINRLRKGMKLQADPTVIYGVEMANGGKPIGHALTGTELRTPTPYNTYTNTGLPPTPIANPGRSSLEAVLNPPETNEFYFVATGTGGHNFSATMGGHSKNVAEYRKILKQQKP